MEMDSILKVSIGVIIGALIGWGITSTGSPGKADPNRVPEDARLIRLERDNESLRRNLENLEEQLAAAQNTAALDADSSDHSESTGSISETYFPENPQQLGRFVGFLRQDWDRFREQYAEERPGPGDEGYTQFLADFQRLVGDSAVLGAQVNTMRTYEPSEFAKFHSEFAASYLGLDPQQRDTITPVVEDLVVQLNEHGLGRDSYPEDRAKRREWFRTRNQFERESTQVVAQLLPEEKRDAYVQAFDDDIFESGIGDMLREMRRFLY